MISDRERARRHARRLAMTESDRELERAYFRAYYLTHKIEYRLRQDKNDRRPEARALMVAKSMRWRDKNRSRYLAAQHSRRSLIKEDPGSVIYCVASNAIRFGGLNGCERCGRPLGVRSLTIDHIVPLSKGGGVDSGNLQVLCGSCNKSKNDSVADYRRVSIDLQTSVQSVA